MGSGISCGSNLHFPNNERFICPNVYIAPYTRACVGVEIVPHGLSL